MLTLKVSSRADPTLVFPSWLIADHLEQSTTLPLLTKAFRTDDALSGDESIQLELSDGKTLSGNALLDYFVGLANGNASSQRASAIQKWVETSKSFVSTDFGSLRKPLDDLDKHFLLRTHVVGYGLSVADLALWGTLRGNKVTQAFIKKSNNNLSRWYSYIEESNPWIPKAVAELTGHAAQERIARSAAGASYDIDMPNINGPMVTRFPPEPSGYLHIGHAKAALLNDYFAHRYTGGTLLVRFDDTNPTKESMEFQDAILNDLSLMEIYPDRISYSSDYFQAMYDYALKLIKDGKAFADDSELGKGNNSRRDRLPSQCRDLSIEETLAKFGEMKTGSQEGLRWCLRARIAYDSPNGTLRDPVIFRCNLTPHHRTGTQWKIYPTYDFCAPILDSLEGVTVALRTNEYRDRNAQYEWAQDVLGLRKVIIWDFSRINFIRTLLSKRKLTKIVDQGKVWGWDDPRMPTITGILRRGMTVPALREFILKQGPSRNVLNLEWGALWALNKKYIDPVAPRHTAIILSQAVHCRVRGIDRPDVATKPKYIKNPDLGTKQVIYDQNIILDQADAQNLKQDEEITLMNWGNAYVRSITKDPATNAISEVDLELHLEGDVKRTNKLTWLAATSTNMIPVDLVSFDHLLTKDKLEKDDNLEDFLTPDTEFRNRAFADCNVMALARGAIIQFERRGYYRLDIPYEDVGSRMVFFEIPGGKA